MKIRIGNQDIEVPPFIAEAMKKPKHDEQFHAFLKQVLTAQAGKIRAEILRECEPPLAGLHSLFSGFNG